MLKLMTLPFIYEGDYCFVEDGGSDVSFKVYRISTNIPGSWIRNSYISAEKYKEYKHRGVELTSLDVFDLLEVLKSTPKSESLVPIRDYLAQQYLT